PLPQENGDLGTFRAGSPAMTLHHFPVPVLCLGSVRAGARAAPNCSAASVTFAPGRCWCTRARLMESLIVKIFATALAFSQVATAPEAVQTRFDRAQDQQEVAQLLRAGCAHMRKALDIENIDLEEFITIALDDPQAVGESKVFRGINFA